MEIALNDCIGILFIKTKHLKETYRVVYLTSLDELYYDDILEKMTTDANVVLENARILFSDSPVLLSRELAYSVADEIQIEKKSKQGIKLISIPTTDDEF